MFLRPAHHAVRLALLAGAVAALISFTLMAPPIEQPADYNHWVDTRTVWDIPYFGDIVSNLGFLLVGLWGLAALALGQCRCALPGERTAWLLVFTGVTLTAFGSVYYHWEPGNARLTWDRLPMAVAFTALLAAVIIERVSPLAGRRLLPALLLFGVSSVLYWYWSDLQGSDDLRPYLLTQGGTLVLIPLMLWLFPPRYDRGGDYVVALILYAGAMAAEHLDEPLFSLTAGWLSGHNLKHLIAAAAAGWLVRMLLRRTTFVRSKAHP